MSHQTTSHTAFILQLIPGRQAGVEVFLQCLPVRITAYTHSAAKTCLVRWPVALTVGLQRLCRPSVAVEIH